MKMESGAIVAERTYTDSGRFPCQMSASIEHSELREATLVVWTDMVGASLPPATFLVRSPG